MHIDSGAFCYSLSPKQPHNLLVLSSSSSPSFIAVSEIGLTARSVKLFKRASALRLLA